MSAPRCQTHGYALFQSADKSRNVSPAAPKRNENSILSYNMIYCESDPLARLHDIPQAGSDKLPWQNGYAQTGCVLW